MRAAVLKARGRFEIDRAYPDPRLSPTDLKLRVLFSGICGSDLHEFVGRTSDGADAVRARS
jgi:threonine dehydrogenase-like Zn-dependent dehydrogenase